MSDLGFDQPELSTPRLRLRRLAPADAALIHLYASDARVARMTTSLPHPYPPGSAEAFIARATRIGAAETVWALDTGEDRENGLVGVISLKSFGEGVAEIGYWVAPAFWNTGYAGEAVEGLNTLIDYRYQQHFFARNGQGGSGKQRTGKSADDVVLRVPVGTELLEEDEETVIADLTAPGQRVLLARGGNGGWGNAQFKTSTNQAPRRANPGQEGVERTIWLRLKLIADAGLVGLPNAGKSTFLAATSNAQPKIADYPFTTLHPGLGVVGIDGAEFVMADIPGLIEGASEGKGLGDTFLGHVERCAVLLHLVDATSPTLVEDYLVIVAELEAYGGGLDDKPRVVGLNKIDALDDEERAAAVAALRAERVTPMLLSGATGENVPQVLRALRARIEAERGALAVKETEAWRP